MTTLARRAMTVSIATAGAAAFWLAGLPLPMLFGPMFACLLAALAGLSLLGLGQVSIAARAILGVAIGAGITPDVLGRLPEMAASAALVPVYIALIGCVGMPFFRRVYRFDPATSWYAAMPGGLQDMVIFGTEAGGDPRALALIHTTRVLIIVTLAPIILTQGFGVTLGAAFGKPAAEIPVTELALMVFAAVAGWKGGVRLGLFGASIIGPLILSGAMSLAGLITVRPPSEAILSAQFLIGIALGVSYVGVTLGELRRDVLAGVFYVLILAALAAAFTELVVIFGLADPVEGFLAFAPGGQAEMTILAIAAGADLGFVIVHHLIRVLVVIAGAPIAARFIRGAGRK